MGPELKPSHTVTAKLIKGSDAAAVVAVLMSSSPSAVVQDHGTYLSLENEGSLFFNLTDIGEELGRPYDIPTFLAILASYTGQVDVQDNAVLISETYST